VTQGTRVHASLASFSKRRIPLSRRHDLIDADGRVSTLVPDLELLCPVILCDG